MPTHTTEQKLEAAAAAVAHVIRRMQMDSRLASLIGEGSESFELLTAAQAMTHGLDLVAYRYQLRTTLRYRALPFQGDAP